MKVSVYCADLFSFATVYKSTQVDIQLDHMKKYLSLFAFVGIGLFLSNSQSALATSGACSYHGGVNCSAGPGAYGNVTCNDGWTGSSVAYSSMTECRVSKPSCMALYPTSYSGCRQESDYTNVQNQIDAKYSIMGMIGEKQYTDEKASRLQECRKSINDYQSIMSSYNQCIQNSYQAAPTIVQPATQQIVQPTIPVIATATEPITLPLIATSSNEAIIASSTSSGGLYDSQGNYQGPRSIQTQTSGLRMLVPKNNRINSILSLGSSGDDVTTLQNILEDKGFLKMPIGSNRGYFGMLTKRALSAFQKSVNLPATGYFGALTRSKINN